MKLENLTTIQERIRQKVMAENLLSTKELSHALVMVPAAKMWGDVQYIYNFLLPKIEAKQGRDSLDYKLFRGVVDTILWAMVILNRYEKLLTENENNKFMAELCREKMLFYESELKNYTSVEELMHKDSLRDYAAVIMKQAEEMLNQKTNIP